jgi:hypothetical protein
MIEASAPHKKTWRVTLDIASNGALSTVIVPELEDEEGVGSKAKTESTSERSVQRETANGDRAPAESAKTQATASPSPALEKAIETSHPANANTSTGAPSSSNALRTVGWVTAGVGLAGIGAGAILGNLAKSSKKLADELCSSGPNGDACRDAQEERDYHAANVRATNRATLAYTGFIAGGVLLTAGTILILAAPSSSSASSRVGRTTVAVPTVGPEGWGISVQGRW